MKEILKKVQPAVKALVIVLCLCELFTLPLVVKYTLCSPVTPDHTLTYTHGNLSWDNTTRVRSNGTAELSLFDSIYIDTKNGMTVESEDGAKLVAPGTDGRNILRLHNQVSDTISFVAVCYEIKSTENKAYDLPVSAQMSGTGLTDTTQYGLPDGVKENNVIRAVKGTVQGYGIQDFDISWFWDYEETDNLVTRDQLDTYLGDLAADGYAEDVTLGFYITVEDSSGHYVPKTSDTSHMTIYLVLMVVSFIALIAMVGEDRKKKNKT